MEKSSAESCAVLCCADVSVCPEALEPLREVCQVEVLPPERELVLRRIAEFDGYLASLQVKMDREMLERAERLKVIATPTTGLDHLDLELAAERGIQVLSLRTEQSLLEKIPSTAELAWALLLAAVRRLPWAVDAALAGHWARDEFRGHQLGGKTLGIIGCGRLGRIVAEYGKAFRMRVLGCDVRPVTLPGVQMVDLDVLLAESDVITLHIHLTEENRRFVDAEKFAKMKKGVVLVNTSRGAIIDEAAFLAALRSGQVAAAGVDVIEGEWRADLTDHPLIQYARAHDNLVITPHIGGVTYEAQATTLVHMARRLAEALVP